MIKVKNLTGTTDKKCNCKTWLKHWENVSGKSLPATCREISCRESPTIGAHVKKVESTDNDHYIVPLCQSHNKTSDEFYVMDGSLVSANKSETCDK